ncbi:MAG TPA: glucose 1-dehydrogenase [Alphaproteobacteria bacterium]|nr:glucose 1-dehydrogenase [Alphaproteobacteria bacterium]
MQRVKDKSIIITGGALGIGKAASLLCAKQGAKVAVTDINDEEGNKVVKAIEANGGHAHFWHLNTAEEKEVESVMAAVYKQFGKIDVLVNNAGIAGVNKPTHEVSEAEWDALMAVNVKGVFFCTKHVIPYLQKNKGGSIINLSSIYGIVGAPDLPAYHASKGAVRLMSKTDAMFYAKDKIRVNSVHPGYIWTPLVEKLGEQSPEGVTAFREHLDSLHPLGHVGEPDDIAYGILYLASDESDFVTGSELVIDGGYTAR